MRLLREAVACCVSALYGMVASALFLWRVRIWKPKGNENGERRAWWRSAKREVWVVFASYLLLLLSVTIDS